VAAHGGDGDVDVGSFVVELGGDPVDQPSDAGDLLVGRGGLGPGPGVDVGGGAEAFAGAQQVVEVCLQVG